MSKDYTSPSNEDKIFANLNRVYLDDKTLKWTDQEVFEYIKTMLTSAPGAQVTENGIKSDIKNFKHE